MQLEHVENYDRTSYKLRFVYDLNKDSEHNFQVVQEGGA